jgi:hypothetical protein
MGSLPSWRDGSTKQAIVEYVEQVNRASVPSPERVAVFDNDGTLWCEKPMYIQLDFLVRGLAAQVEMDATLRNRVGRDDGRMEVRPGEITTAVAGARRRPRHVEVTSHSRRAACRINRSRTSWSSGATTLATGTSVPTAEA